MSAILVAFFCLLIAWKMWRDHYDKRQCAYCGHHRGHRQDCPVDFENREER